MSAYQNPKRQRGADVRTPSVRRGGWGGFHCVRAAAHLHQQGPVDVTELPPINRHGNVIDIAAAFGGEYKLMEVIERLQPLLLAE